MTKPKQTKVVYKFAKERDLECHIRTQSVLGTDFFEVRDYVPSTQTYARGFIAEMQHLPRLLEGLNELARLKGGSSFETPVQMEGQGVLF